MIILLMVSLSISVYIIQKRAKEDNILTFYLPRSSSFSSNWCYDVSNENILREGENEVYDYFFFRQYDYYELTPIASGEVTIYFIAQYETEVVEEKCFSITYYVDENYNITEISSDNKPEHINYDDDIVGLIELKIADRITVFLINLFAWLVYLLDL